MRKNSNPRFLLTRSELLSSTTTASKARIAFFVGLFFLVVVQSTAQTILVTGKVISSDDRKPLSGVNISLKSSTNVGTATDRDGAYSISVPTDSSTLIFSYVGYNPVEENVVGRSVINTALEAKITALNEVVVVGYGTQLKKDLTGALTSVGEKNFNKGNFTSPDQLIKGKVAGVQIISNSGQPGVASTIKIRGNSVLTGTGQPLFVVDGVPLSGNSARPNTADGDSPIGNPLNFLNPSDIASIDVLKDASATAIYGSRAAYGVIIFNTKKGQSGEPKIDVMMSAGISSIQHQVKVLDSAQYRQAIEYYESDTTANKKGSADGFGSILREAKQQNFSIGVSGGNTNGKYRFSFGYYNQEGILLKSEIKKYTASFSGSFKFLESKKMGMDINLNTNQNLEKIPFIRNQWGIVGLGLWWNPTDSLKNADGSLSIQDGEFNPLAITALSDDNAKVTNILASIAPHYELTDWLDFKILASINYGTGIRRTSTHQDIDFFRHFGTAGIFNNETFSGQITNTLTFHKEILRELNVTAIVGYEYMKFTNKGSSVDVQGPDGGFGNYGLDYTNYIQYSDPTKRNVSSFEDPLAELQSYFGRAIINFKSKYLLTATFRADGSTKFGSDNKYGYFPSFSGAWVASEEDFFNLNFLNFLKFRVGWGKTGNQEFPSGASSTLYGFQSNGIISQANNPNPDLKWQSDEQINVGTDFTLKNRVSCTLDYFRKTTTDLLFPNYPIQPAPPGAAITWVNLDGQVRNTGVEVTINASILDKENLSWNFNVNTSFIKNTVSGLPVPIQTGWATAGATVQTIKNGLPMNTFYTRKFLCIDQDSGLSKYEDDGYTLFDVGNPNPTTLLGINTDFRFKKITLEVNMYGAFGQSVYNNTLSGILSVAGINVGKNISLDEFQKPVKESIYNPVTSSSRFVEKADYLKMGNATLTYNFNTIGKAFKQAKIYVTGQNLFTITKYTGFNPEVNIDRNNNGVPSLGIDNHTYPLARTYIIGFSFTL